MFDQRWLLLFNTTRRTTFGPQTRGPLSLWTALLFSTTRIRACSPDPMDGGVADTTLKIQAVNRHSARCGRRGDAVLASVLDRCTSSPDCNL